MDEELDTELMSLANEFENGEGIMDDEDCPLISELNNQATMLKKEEE